MFDTTVSDVHPELPARTRRSLSLHLLAEPRLAPLPPSTIAIASLLGAYSDAESAARAALCVEPPRGWPQAPSRFSHARHGKKQA